MYVSTKNYGPEAGLAVAYRQWRAESHCRLIHGYAMGFYFEFESESLDFRNWCVDYGSLKPLKEQLQDWFDHTLLVAQDDPEFKTFEELHNRGLCKMVVVEKTGCEGLSKWLYDYVNEIWLPDNGYNHVHCRLVKVTETPSNAAWYECRTEEHDRKMMVEFNHASTVPVTSYDEAINCIRAALDFAKRVKLTVNKNNVLPDYNFLCTRLMNWATSDDQRQEIKLLQNSI